MPKFRVMLIRDCTQYASVEVEADNEEGAEEAAQDWVDNGNPLDWDLSDDAGPVRVLEDETEEV
jgi:hypothetical protein